MDTFLSSMVSDFGYQQSEIKKILNELIERGENDIQNYLNYCYNNPYDVTLSETLISIINSEKNQLEKSRLILAFSRNSWNILIKN